MAAQNNCTYTISYDPGVGGFPSFYSYVPDFMMGMNSYFYTFYRGNLYRHNTNETRNQYYGVNYPSKLQSVFNEEPFHNKLFKTINLEGDDAWGAIITSDQQDTGFIEASYFEKKEGDFYAFIRNSGQSFTSPANPNQYALRSLNGIGSSQNIVVAGNETTVSFITGVYLGNIISVGDMVYFGNPNPSLLGQVTAINVNLPAGINEIVVDNTIVGAVPAPTTTEYILYIKNSVAESHGMLGHYSVFTLTNDNTSKIELFSVESEVMKSFP
jgi:hypothetical protein